MKRQSISYRLNLILLMIAVVILAYSATVIYLGTQVNSSTKQVINYDMPSALNTLAMLEELGDMNSNLLEYVLGEQEEEQEYYSNFDEFRRFRELIPETVKKHNSLERVSRIVEGHTVEAKERVFDIYHPRNEQSAAQQINTLIKDVGGPLERLLDEMKEQEIADIGSGNNVDEIINDDLPGVRFYLELVDEAGDMLADLDRFVLGDPDAKRAFFANALQFESYLAQLKPLEQKPQEIIRLKEIDRMFKELKYTGEAIFNSYQATTKKDAMKAIDDLEHQSFSEAEKLLDNLSGSARDKVNTSMTGLGRLANQISVVLGLATFIVIVLTAAILIYSRKYIFSPIAEISSTIEKLRKGERGITVTVSDRNDELTDVLISLQQFQEELAELDELRARENELKDEAEGERDKAQDALNQLKETQDKLVANEKMASLGTLVAGVSHEVNTPLGVSVTMASTIKHNVNSFLENVKSGALKRTALERFEQETIESVELLSNSLQQASHLIQNFKKVAIDQTSSKRREFNLFQTLEQVTSTLKHQLKHTNIKYFIEGANDIELDSYPGPFGQVITNLFNNAIVHGFDGKNEGEINIRFKQFTDKKIRILFSDNGCGVDEKFIHKVFDPFFTTKLGKGGSGLGLNIVHNIVTNLLGGTIDVDSRIGTTFEIIMPIQAPRRGDDND